MAWVKGDDRLWCDAKFCAMSDGAQALWHRANSYLADQLLDGMLPESAIRYLKTRARYVQELEHEGYWVRQPSGGWLAVDWQKIIRSKAEVLADRAKTNQRVRRHRNAVTPAVSNACPVPGPVPDREEAAASSPAAAAQVVDASQATKGLIFVASLLGRNTMSVPPAGAHSSAYAWIATKPDAERAAVAKAVNADEWCQKNPSRVDAPHLQRSWQKYLAGPVKQVVRVQQPAAAPAPKYLDPNDTSWLQPTRETA